MVVSVEDLVVDDAAHDGGEGQSMECMATLPKMKNAMQLSNTVACVRMLSPPCGKIISSRANLLVMSETDKTELATPMVASSCTPCFRTSRAEDSCNVHRT